MKTLNVLGGVVTLGGDVVLASNPLTRSKSCRLLEMTDAPKRHLAKVVEGEWEVRHTVYADAEFIRWDIPNGWDDVKKIAKKVVLYDGRKFTFSCWNSDDLYVVFRRSLVTGDTKTATLLS